MNSQKLILLLFLFLGIHVESSASSVLLKIQNCNSSTKSFWVEAKIEVFKNGRYLKTISTKDKDDKMLHTNFFGRMEYELNSLEADIYTFYFKAGKGLKECTSITVKENETRELKICLDYINFDAVDYIPFIDRLGEGDTYSIKMESKGCFHWDEGYFTICKKEGRYLYMFPLNGQNKVLKILNEVELQALRKLEMELKYLVSPGFCTTSTQYTVNFNSEKWEVEDGNCGPNYFQEFLQTLEWF